MDYNEQYNFIRSFLQPNETVLWHGAPGPGKLNSYGRVPILFSVFWLGFSLMWEVVAIWSGILFMILFGIPFVLVGLSIAFGGPIKNAKLKGKIFYAVTDQRLLIIEGEDVSMFTADMLPPMRIRMNKNGTGTIFFESTYRTHNGSHYSCVCSLQNLTDVEQAQNALNTMISKTS
ncbi:MAG: hypothetical protein ACI4N4_01275 [Candidatus Fimenecus sp.]